VNGLFGVGGDISPKAALSQLESDGETISKDRKKMVVVVVVVVVVSSVAMMLPCVFLAWSLW
jgi:hypothetical protein